MGRKESIQKLRDVLLKRRSALRKALAGDLTELEALGDAAGGDEVDLALDSAYDEMSAQLAEMESRELIQIEKRRIQRHKLRRPARRGPRASTDPQRCGSHLTAAAAPPVQQPISAKARRS